MKVQTLNFDENTQGHNQLIDITAKVSSLVKESGFTEGQVLVFVPGSTAGITTIEYEPGLLQDYPEFFEKIAPAEDRYHHNDTWHDGNGYAHVRAALQGASFTVPFSKGKLLLGTWQQIILVDFDNRPRRRNVIVQVTGQ